MLSPVRKPVNFKSLVLRLGQGPLPVLILASLIRLVYMSGVGHNFDLNLFATYGRLVNNSGLFQIYLYPPVDYPPLYLAVLGVIDTATRVIANTIPISFSTLEVFLLKVPPVLGELALIGLAHIWLSSRHLPHRFIMMITLMLALHPALVINSAWWGQFDSLYTLLLVLTLIAFSQNKMSAGWAFWAFGFLIKFQSVVLLPLLVIHSYRRFGVSPLLKGVGIAVFILAVLIAPFVGRSGWSGTLRPYTATMSSYPYITVNAFNFWYAITFGQGNQSPDTQSFVGPLTYKYAGLFLLTLFVLSMCLIVWRRADNPQFFTWAALLFFGFFMLPTEIHERYLYPAAVLTILAAIEDRRLFVIGIGVACTFTLNLLALTEPLPILGWTIHVDNILVTLAAAAANVALCLVLSLHVIFPTRLLRK